MDPLEEAQQLIDSRGFFQAIVRAEDPARKEALYSACYELLQKSPESQKALTRLSEDAKLAAECLCCDISSKPSQGLKSLVHITITIFGQEQAASALEQHRHLQLVQVLADLLKSTHDRVGSVLNQDPMHVKEHVGHDTRSSWSSLDVSVIALHSSLDRCVAASKAMQLTYKTKFKGSGDPTLVRIGCWTASRNLQFFWHHISAMHKMGRLALSTKCIPMVMSMCMCMGRGAGCAHERRRISLPGCNIAHFSKQERQSSQGV